MEYDAEGCPSPAEKLDSYRYALRLSKAWIVGDEDATRTILDEGQDHLSRR